MAYLCATQALARTAGWSMDRPRVSACAALGGAALPLWYLDLVHCRGAKLVLAVDVRTRWAFVLAAAPFASLPARFGPALFSALIAAGVPPDRARGEIDSASPYLPARLTDRSVQAHLRQYKNDVAWAAAEGASIGLLNERLGHRPILAPKESWTDSELLRALGGDPDLPARHAREEGQRWQKAFAEVTAQRGSGTLRLPVARLLGCDRLEAGYQAEMLFVHLRQDPSGVARELVLDLRGIHAVSPAFWQALAALVARHPGLQVSIEAEPEVARGLR